MPRRRGTCQTIIDILKNFFANAPLKSRAQRRPPPDTDSVRQVTKKLARLARRRRLPRAKFEQGVLEAVTKLRDVHTAYTLSNSFKRRIYFLPFLLRRWQDGDVDRYVVTRVDKSKLKQGRRPSKLRPGAEVTHWNGKPIAEAVKQNGLLEEGAHEEASKALGLTVLTTRWAGGSPQPEEKEVSVRFEIGSKTYVETYRWRSITRHAKAVELELDAPNVVFPVRPRRIEQLFRKHFFKAGEPTTHVRGFKRTPIVLDPMMFGEDHHDTPWVEPSLIETKHGKFGYVRIRAFPAGDEFVTGFAELLRLLPQDGLILDLRENPGGAIQTAEMLLQLLTPRPVRVTGFRFIANPATAALTRQDPNDDSNADLEAWHASIQRALRARRRSSRGGRYSTAFPLTDTDSMTICNQRYYGPSVVIVDALTFSAAENLTAGFLDNRIGSVIGAGDTRTGGAGANVWELAEFDGYHRADAQRRPPFFKGADLRFAARQCVRIKGSGRRGFGDPFEAVGVFGNIRYFLTKRDALEQSRDLLLAAAGHLKELNKRRRPLLDVRRRIVGGRRIEVTVIGTNVAKIRAKIEEFSGNFGSDIRETRKGPLTLSLDGHETTRVSITGLGTNGGRAVYQETFSSLPALAAQLRRQRRALRRLRSLRARQRSRQKRRPRRARRR